MKQELFRVMQVVLVLTGLLGTIPLALAQECMQTPYSTECWWPGDDHADSLTPCATGAMVNGAGYGGGKVGQAFRLDGADDYIDFGDILNDVTLPFSIEGWINTAAVRDNPILTSDDPPGSLYGFTLGVNAPRQLTVTYGYYSYWGARSRTKVSEVLIPLNWWTHVAAVVEGPNDIILYVNGVDAGGTYSGNPDTTTVEHSGSPLRIGARSSARFAGKIDELSVYPRALSACELTSLYEAGGYGRCKGDTDGDSILDPVDNCPLIDNPFQEDLDADSAGDVCDCAFDDGGAFSNANEVENVVFESDHVTLAWCNANAGTGTSYDIVSGYLADLPVSNDLLPWCVDTFVVYPEVQDWYELFSGEGYWYLVRGRNYCGTGTYGFQSNGEARISEVCP